MSIFETIKHWVTDPPPEYIFELSQEGLAWARSAEPARVEWIPLPEGVIEVGPLTDNVKRPDELARAVKSVAPPLPNRRRLAALLLPDYAARVAVLDFDTFPSDPGEQIQLVKFRIKRIVPFDIESAVVACYPSPRPGEKKVDVTVAAVNLEIATHYEAPFRSAGYHCGFVTISALAALSLAGGTLAGSAAGPMIAAKRSGSVLAVSLVKQNHLRMFRCVDLPEVNEESVIDILAPTFAFAEDEFGERPTALLLSGFGQLDEAVKSRWSQELGAPVELIRSRFGQPGPANAGVYGYLETVES
jgi:type IV pilus assembly protein PilM